VLAVIGTVLIFSTTFHGLTDVDYFWHVTTGRLIATTGAVPGTDPFSFTYAGGAWTPHEWLGELLIYLLVTYAGGLATLIVFGLVGAGAVGVAMLHARWAGARVAPTAFAAAIATGIVISYLTVRPQAISWLLLAGLMWFLSTLGAERPRRALWLIPLFAVWANLHGLYVVALGVVAVWTLATLLGWTPMAGARRWALGAAVGALAASMLTPAGPAGILYPLRYVQPGNWGLANIQEWQSPNFHDPSGIGLLVLIGALLFAGWGRVAAWQGAVVAIMVLISLVSLRNAPLAAITALPLLATSFDAMLPRRAVRTPSARVTRIRRAMETALAVVLIAATAVIMLPRVLGNQESAIREHLPVTGVDRLLAEQPNARVFAEYGWGGYVIYRMYDSGGRVFVDGRNDMYPERILDDYSAIRNASGDWKAKLDEYGATAILLPPGTGLVGAAEHNPFWCERYRDGVQALLVRCGGG
jgi:hypothetical protein